MAYYCNYIVYSGNTEEPHFGNACFGSVYTRMDIYSKIKIYVPKIFPQIYQAGNKLPFSKEDIEKLVLCLKDIGFNVILSEEKKEPFGDSYTFTWEIGNEENKNGIFSTLILMNIVRYLYENPYQRIIRNFLYLASFEDPEINYWNRLLMSHHSIDPYSGTGHMFGSSYCFELLRTNEQVKSEIINNKRVAKSVSGFLPLSKNIPRAEADIVTKAIEDKLTLKEIHTKYQELCVKYS